MSLIEITDKLIELIDEKTEKLFKQKKELRTHMFGSQ